MKNGHVADKEVRVKLHPKTYSALRGKAQKEMRSITKQVALYIKQGLEDRGAENAR